MVSGREQLFFRWPCHTYIQFVIKLSRVARYDFGLQLLCQFNGMGCFAGRRGSDYEFQCFDGKLLFCGVQP